jgi:hypothetical protein
MNTEVCLLSPPCFVLHPVVSISYSSVNSANVISINNITDFYFLQLLLDLDSWTEHLVVSNLSEAIPVVYVLNRMMEMRRTQLY